jgi:hypothetical protein
VEGLRGTRAGEKYAQTGVFCQGVRKMRKVSRRQVRRMPYPSALLGFLHHLDSGVNALYDR